MIASHPQEPSKPPFFTRKMQPCRVFDKEGARFEVEFTGDPPPEVEWFREDFLIQSSQDFKVSVTVTFPGTRGERGSRTSLRSHSCNSRYTQL